MVDVWLEAGSQNDDLRLIHIVNDIKTYNSFESLDKKEIYVLERIKIGSSSDATARLKPHHSKRVNNTKEYVFFLEASGESALAIDPKNGLK